MPKISEHELKGMLTSARADALSGFSSNKLSSEREKAMQYYLGNVAQDIPNTEGRSTAVSTDVSDTIEGLMPALMEIFAGGDEVVKFDPMGPEDEKAADQETDYVNHVFMQKNSGFLTLYSMIKDALLSKVGVAKVWWETREDETKETYYDLDDWQFASLVSNPEVEIVEHTVKDVPDEMDDTPGELNAGA